MRKLIVTAGLALLQAGPAFASSAAIETEQEVNPVVLIVIKAIIYLCLLVYIACSVAELIQEEEQ